MTTQNKDPLVPQVPNYDPFPEPHTFPSGWDLSELFHEPRPASVGEEDCPPNAQTDNNLASQTLKFMVDK